MKGRLAAAALLLAGCSWSNSLYQARTLARTADRAEREQLPGEAQTIWGQVVVKAESAYARAPGGRRGAEALWLTGHASVRINDCPRAIRAFQGALFSGADQAWHQQLLLELAQCEEATGSPTAASVYAMLGATADAQTRRTARFHQGHVLVGQGSWAEGLDALEGLDTVPARLDRALALAELGRDDAALTDLAPFLARRDTTVQWLRFIEAFAPMSTPATDTLLGQLLSWPMVSDEVKSSWLLASIRDAMDADHRAAERRLSQLLGRPPGPAVTEGRMLQLQLAFVNATSLAELRAAITASQRAPSSEGSYGALRLAELQNFGRLAVAKHDSAAPGSPQGDLMMFALGELARDSMRAPAIGVLFFTHLERDWPASPYTAKAMIARAALEPDSADALRVRLQARTDNAYVRAAGGERAGQARMAQLEDSLGIFVRAFWLTVPAAQTVQ